jgi:hypothetical protein
VLARGAWSRCKFEDAQAHCQRGLRFGRRATRRRAVGKRVKLHGALSALLLSARCKVRKGDEG